MGNTWDRQVAPLKCGFHLGSSKQETDLEQWAWPSLGWMPPLSQVNFLYLLWTSFIFCYCQKIVERNLPLLLLWYYLKSKWLGLWDLHLDLFCLSLRILLSSVSRWRNRRLRERKCCEPIANKWWIWTTDQVYKPSRWFLVLEEPLKVMFVILLWVKNVCGINA